jgi:hypothetical protein
MREARDNPRGTGLDITGVWDNSAGNRFNPDPRAEVRWGDQSWEEMLLGPVTLSIDPQADVNTFVRRAQEENRGRKSRRFAVASTVSPPAARLGAGA